MSEDIFILQECKNITDHQVDGYNEDWMKMKIPSENKPPLPITKSDT